VRPVGDRDDPGGVEHLDQHHEMVLSLEDLHVVVVGGRVDREPGGAETPVEIAKVLYLLQGRGTK
jgi:hypothetical protein